MIYQAKLEIKKNDFQFLVQTNDLSKFIITFFYAVTKKKV